MGFKSIVVNAVSAFRSVSATIIPSWGTYPMSASGGFAKNTGRFSKNELIFACVEKTCHAASQVSLVVKRKRDSSILPNHPLQQLLERPNPFMSECDLLESIIMLQLLSGRAVLEKERDNAGRVIGLWPLRPDWLKIQPSPTNIIEGFWYGPAGVEPDFIPYENVIDMPLSDPRSTIVPAHPLAPVSLAARVSDTDDTVTDFVKKVFDEGGVPPGLLKTKQKLIDSQVVALRRRWKERYGGAHNWLEPAVLDCDAEYQKVGMTVEEMGFQMLDRRNESRICLVMDVPPIIVGAFVGVELSSYDNYLTARKAWWQDSLIPRFKYIRDRLRVGLLAEFGSYSTLQIELDLSGVAALQEEVDLVWRRMSDAFRTGALTVNMYLTGIGYSPIGPAGDIFLRPLNYTEVPLYGPKPSDEPDEEEPVDENQDEEDGAKAFPIEITHMLLKEPDPALRREHDDQYTSAVKKGFSELYDQLKETLERDGVQAILAE